MQLLMALAGHGAQVCRATARVVETGVVDDPALRDLTPGDGVDEAMREVPAPTELDPAVTISILQPGPNQTATR